MPMVTSLHNQRNQPVSIMATFMQTISRIQAQRQLAATTSWQGDSDEDYQLADDDEESQLFDTHIGPTLVGHIGMMPAPQPGRANNSCQNEDDEESQFTAIKSIRPASPFQPPSSINIQQHFNYDHSQNTPMHREIPSATPTEILSAGLSYAGFDLNRQQHNKMSRRVVWFKAFYGVEPNTVAPFFVDLKNEYPDIVYKDCLMTMNWVTLYETYVVMSGRWKYCEEYIGSKVVEYGFKMRKVAMRKIKFELDDDIELGRSVDCTTCKVQEFRLDPSTAWFDYKTHSCGLKYETCLAIREPQICWISGPYAPSTHDITVFRGGTKNENKEDWDPSALYFKFKNGEKCVADSGYAGEPEKVVMTKDEHSSEFKEFLARVKNRQETFHTRLKSFNILGHRFRHGKNTQKKMELHKMAFELVTGIVQYDYDNGHPPFDVC